MVKENQIIRIINQSDLEVNNTIRLINCFIDTIDLVGAFELKVKLVIENCIINNFQIHSCWFVNGLVLRNSIVKNYVDYQMGGHNINPIILEGNIFIGFFNFFDCQFDNTIELKDNIFRKGSNLLGNRGEGFENKFKSGWILENNLGSVDINEMGI